MSSMQYKIISWNVNGVRAIEKKGFSNLLSIEKPDVLCLQETRALLDQVSDYLRNPPGYNVYWNSAEQKGYSGVVVYSKAKAIGCECGLGSKLSDKEGRVLFLEYEKYILYNIYFPNGKQSKERLRYKLDFYQDFLDVVCNKLKQKKQKTIVVCGDFNTAHKEIDLARPKENSHVSGFLSEERLLIDKLIDIGMADTFRMLHQESRRYTWWDRRTRARQRNVG